MARRFATFAAVAGANATARGNGGRRVAAVVVVTLACAALAFGLSDHDAAVLRSFAGAVDRWQTHPEFRSLAAEYSTLGSEALRTGPLGVPADRMIVAARSFPLLPERYALAPTTRVHYQNFSGGPLRAYLHLCDEQAVHHVIPMVEDLGQRLRQARGATPGLPEFHAFLAAFKMDTPVVKDAGAAASVAALLADTQAGVTAFRHRGGVGASLGPHVQALARELGFPPDVRRMSAWQQRAVLDRLDAYVRRRDPELWRTKQVSDFCAGIWAHVFGRNYNLLIKPYLALHLAGRVGLLLLVIWAGVRWVRLRQQSPYAAAAPARAFAVTEVVAGPTALRPVGESVSGAAKSNPLRARPRRAGARRRRS